MIVLNHEIRDISEAIMSKIIRMYEGKAIQTVDINYVCITSPCSNHSLISLFVYWNLLIQNVYTTNLRCIIVDDNISNSTSDIYLKLISKIKDSKIENFMDRDIIEITDPDTYSDNNINKSKNKIIISFL